MIKKYNKVIKQALTILCYVFVVSCQNKKDTNNLETINETVNIENKIKEKPKYIFVVFYVEEPKLKIEKQFTRDNQDPYDLEIKYKDYYYVEFEKTTYKSEIQEIIGYNEDKKFKILDNLESKLNTRLILVNLSFHNSLLIKCKDEDVKETNRETECRITDRQIFTYDSYSEASQARQNFNTKVNL